MIALNPGGDDTFAGQDLFRANDKPKILPSKFGRKTFDVRKAI